MRRRHLLAALPGLAGPAAAMPPPVLVEMFTSQSCSSCPPADALLAELVGRPGVLALSLHVTYWDRLGWRDRFSLPAATERQRRYATTLGHGQVYTPQAVVQGARDVVGSDRGALLAALRAAAPAPVTLGLAAEGGTVALTAGEGAGEGSLWLVGFDRRHVTPIGGGENGGRTLTHVNVVRSLRRVGAWAGGAVRIAAPRPEGERLALLLQATEGPILGLGLA